jgi:hypothetical protein
MTHLEAILHAPTIHDAATSLMNGIVTPWRNGLFADSND